MTHTVVRQEWLESERGWGIRPDGYSLHVSEADRVAFIREYWDRMPDHVPDEYSRPCGNPELVDIDEALYDELKTSRNGIRRYR